MQFWHNDFERFRLWVVDRPKQAIAVSLLLAVIALSGFFWFSTTTDYRVYFGDDVLQLKEYDYFEQQFEQAETTLLVLQATEGDMFTPEHLQALRITTDQSLLIPYARRAVSLVNYHESRAEGDDIIIEPLLADGEITLAAANRIRDVALYNDELLNRLISTDGTIALVAVQNPLPRDDLNAEVPKVANAARQLESFIEFTFPTIEVHLSGIVMLNDAMKQTTRWDMSRLFPAMFFLVLLGQWLFFRRFIPAAVTVAIYGLVATVSYGISGWLSITMNAASMAAGLVVIVLSIADCIHILVTYYQEIDHYHKARREAMLESLRINLLPVFITSLTTVIGFLSLNFSVSPPFQDLGNIVALGVVYAFLFSVMLMPAILMLVKTKPRKAARPANPSPFMSAFAEFVLKFRWVLLPVMLVIVVLLSFGISGNKFGDNYSEYFDETLDFRRSTEFINDKLAGMQALEYVITAPQEGGVNEPEFLRNLERFADYLEDTAQIPEARKAISLVKLHKRLNKTMHGDDPDFYRLPDSQAMAAQYLFMFQMSLGEGQTINNMVDHKRQATVVTMLLDTVPANRLAEIDRQNKQWLADNFPNDYDYKGVGIGLMFANIAEQNFTSMIEGIALAFIVISLLLVVIFRSWKIGLMSLIPNIVPAVMAFGVWGYTVAEIGISLAVVASLTLGIVVDDTVHMLSKYQRARRERGYSPEDAVRYAFRTVGTALTLTSIVLVVGFIVIAQSSYQLTEYMAMMTAITIGIALVADFLLLPPLLLLIEKLRFGKNSLDTGDL